MSEGKKTRSRGADYLVFRRASDSSWDTVGAARGALSRRAAISTVALDEVDGAVEKVIAGEYLAVRASDGPIELKGIEVRPQATFGEASEFDV